MGKQVAPTSTGAFGPQSCWKLTLQNLQTERNRLPAAKYPQTAFDRSVKLGALLARERNTVHRLHNPSTR